MKTNEYLAQACNVQLEKINSWIAQGLIPTLHTGRKWYVDTRTGVVERCDLIAYIDDEDARNIIETFKKVRKETDVYG